MEEGPQLLQAELERSILTPWGSRAGLPLKLYEEAPTDYHTVFVKWCLRDLRSLPGPVKREHLAQPKQRGLQRGSQRKYKRRRRSFILNTALC